MENVLDMGCGPGYITEFLSGWTKIRHIIGVDFSENMIEFARSKSKGKATYLVGDAETFDTNERFDVVIAKGLFEYLEDDEKALRNIHRLLKMNGYLIAEFRHANFKHGEPNYVDPYPMKRRSHDPEHLKELTEKLGFDMKETVFYHHHKGLETPEAASAFVSLFQKR